MGPCCFACFLLLIYLNALQLEQQIMNFSEGLRVVGVTPAEKVALFADNSCRWLIADQGMHHSPFVRSFEFLVHPSDLFFFVSPSRVYD